MPAKPAPPPTPAPPFVDDDLPPDATLPPADPVVHRGDGYYWISEDTHEEFGPFASYEDARADLHAADDDVPEPGDALREVEAELGIADWIDPETGDPAEGMSRPHLDSE